jgi:hypothetical protein
LRFLNYSLILGILRGTKYELDKIPLDSTLRVSVRILVLVEESPGSSMRDLGTEPHVLWKITNGSFRNPTTGTVVLSVRYKN